MLFKSIAILLLLMGSAYAWSQPVLYGRIFSDKGDTVSYATVWLKKTKTGTISDEAGHFSVSADYRNDSLEITALGHYAKTLWLNDTVAMPLRIILRTKTYEIDQINVSAEGAKALIRQVIRNIPINYPQSPYVYQAFYRQTHKEDDRYVRLIEAATSIYDPGFNEEGIAAPKEQVNIEAVRRSFVYEQNGYDHADHLFDILLANVVHHPKTTFLDPKALQYYSFKFDTSSSVYDFGKVACVRYSYRHVHNPKMTKGRIFVDRTNYAVLRIESRSERNPKYISRSTFDPSTWEFLEGSKIIQFKKVGQQYFPDSIAFYYKHHVVDEQYRMQEFIVEEFFDLWTGNVTIIDEDFTPRSYKRFSSLYSKGYEYNPVFWENYSLLQKHPASKEVISGLEHSETLQEQFINSGK